MFAGGRGGGVHAPFATPGICQCLCHINFGLKNLLYELLYKCLLRVSE